MTEGTSELIEAVYQLAVESRVRASMVQSDYRRGNVARLRRAKRSAERVTRLAADLTAQAFQVVDRLNEEIRTQNRIIE
ncbi:MAG: hypothetical protein ABSE84_00490 [Isosphaeraceae bacterium]|jgi:hypothetical protein